ncbi:MAG: signal recognition particle protein [Candidatus Methanomethylicota archaeon]|nr:MAG: signal recognition particle protein [Candidatus Verstraetearchaeota archaeon]
MVLENLTKSLGDAIRKVIRAPLVDRKVVKELIRDIQRALLQADVNVQLVLQLSQRIERRVFEEELPPGITRRELLLKIVYDELVNLLGGEGKPQVIPSSRKSYVIMLVGIQGSGKTTTAAKLALFYKKNGLKTALICADNYRPGAYAQLKQLGESIGVPVYGVQEKLDASEIARRGVDKFRREGYNIIIVDTAGRHKEEKTLIEEMKRIAEKVSPDEIMLVIDGTIGQQAMIQAKAFNEATKIGSIFITKLDGSARGGGALSAVAATGAPIKFIGVGEKVDEIEVFIPSRFVSRLLGMGDLETLVEKVKAAEIAPSEKAAERLMSGKFTLNDLLEQFKSLSKMGPLGKLLKLIPGFGISLPEGFEETSKDKLKKYMAIIQSMTPEERENPEIINRSRIRRIAIGSGTTVRDVRELLKQYRSMKKLIRQFKRKSRVFRQVKGFRWGT